jgi:hypothetical protein
MLVPYVLDMRGFDWMESVLRSSMSLSLSREVLASVDLRDGTLFAFLPPSMNDAVVYNFEGGVLAMQPGDWLGPYGVSALLKHQLKGATQSLRLTERRLWSASDPWVQRATDAWTFGDEVYEVQDSASAEAVPEKGHIFAYPEATTVIAHDCLSRDFFTSGEPFSFLCGRLSCLLFGAYDGDSYVLWERGRHSVPSSFAE